MRTRRKRGELLVPVQFRRRTPQEYEVWREGRYIGIVWKATSSGWYCNAGNSPFTNRTRREATNLLLQIVGKVKNKEKTP